MRSNFFTLSRESLRVPGTQQPSCSELFHWWATSSSHKVFYLETFNSPPRFLTSTLLAFACLFVCFRAEVDGNRSNGQTLLRPSSEASPLPPLLLGPLPLFFSFYDGSIGSLPLRRRILPGLYRERACVHVLSAFGTILTGPQTRGGDEVLQR